ncbi:zinc transport system ATP-binding protein [Oribacterium sp. KHPX15]|uniref:metal ABC transporter ATP-binding protein n=1 Tax=Oribacterium sp. KHPX15 TaxID=1855342 RepID=UPI0008946B0F|nr:ABC transporter ATP-binding protein [Oribacterium sp. KHPX15]SEA73869.1 zinc transport system ATP-binding protein [Oribacterium sp. KHPX15]
MAYITCTDLAVGYSPYIVAKEINFEINKGDYICVVGENGAGKSTLMKTILHLQSACEGSITLGDGLTPREIGYLPQQTLVQRDFPATVREIVLSGTITKGFGFFYSKEQKQTAENMMEQLHIADLASQSYRQLSGGQQQRVLLARALCATDKLLVLDEPISGLDPSATDELYQLISELNANGTSILMVTHDLNALQYASHVLHVNKDSSLFLERDAYLESKNYIKLNKEESDGMDS